MPTITLTVTKTGPADGVTSFNSITAALAQANTLSDEVVIEVGAGTYDENPVIGRSDISLVATAGRGATTIAGTAALMGPGSQGTVTLLAGTNNVAISGFTILGFDGTNPGVEVAAVYLQGAHSDFALTDNEIVAQGEAGLLTEYSPVLDNIVVTGNIFSGQTFVGANPGIGDQWTVANVPRQLVVISGNGQNASNVTFSNNEITGTTGGLTTGNVASGNSLVTIDADNSTISGNVFTGFTNGNGWQLRVRESGNTLEGNNFSSPLGGKIGLYTEFASGEAPAVVSDTTLSGSNADDAILSTSGNDLIEGGGGNDTIYDLGGSDSISGGGGNDRVVYAGPAYDYDVTRNGDGSYTVAYTGTVAALAGTDTLTGVEGLSFAGQSYATELLTNAPSTAGYTLRFHQDFSAGTAGIPGAANGGYGIVTHVPDMAADLPGASGGGYAILEQSGAPGSESGPFFRFDGYRADFGDGYATSVRIYLDTHMALGEGFDYSVAASNQSGGHLRDFIFHVTADASTGTIVIGADNNTNFAPQNNLETKNHVDVTTSGWYTFQHNFYENADGNLEVAMSVFDASGAWLFTEISSTTDAVATQVGGNRYGWFTNIDVTGGIMVDDIALATSSDGEVQLRRGNVILGEFDTPAEAAAEASDPADYIVDADGVFHVFDGMYLQAAINAASAGATIMVAGGALGDTGVVTVDKQLTILGANEGLAGDDSGRGTESVLGSGTTMNITAEGVVIDGMKFLGGGTVLGSSAGIYVGANGVTIRNTVLEGNGSAYTGITTPYGGNVTGLSITGNLFTGWDSSAYFNPTTGVSITGNHFNATGSLNIGNLATGSLVDNNEFTGSLGAPIAYDVMDSDEDVSQFIGTGNTFDNGPARDVSIYVYGNGSAGTTVTGTSLNDRFVTDYMTNANSADTFFGGAGDDTIHGSGGADSISGGADNDVIVGGAGDDQLDGGDGIDTLDVSDAGTGGAFVELNLGVSFSSAGGFDHAANFENIRGSAGNDALFGSDDDNVFFASGGNDAIDGRDGTDTFDAGAATAALTVDLAAESASGAHSGVLMNIENVIAGSGDDSLTGNDGDNVLNGGAGNDRIAGGAGNDTIIGGGGVDTVVFAEAFDSDNVDFIGMTITTATEGTDTVSGIERMVFDDRTVFIVQAGDSIQAAIDAAAEGDLIFIAAGTHVLPTQLNVNKGVELRGAGEGQTILQTAATGWGIYVTADDVTLKGFSVDAAATTLYGIKVSPDGVGPAEVVTGLEIDHVTISGAGRTELDLNRVDNSTLSNLTLDGNGTAGNGLSLSASNHITVENLTTLDNLWGGVAIYPETSGPDWTDGSDDITFTGTLDLGEAQGLYIQESGSSAATNIEVEGWDEVYIVKNDTFRPGAEQYTFLFETEAEALAFATALPTPKDSVVTGPEGNDLPDTDLGSVFIVGPGMSIQAAIDAAEPGDTIQVLEGTYAENVTVNKDGLTIIGIGDPEDIIIQGTFKADNAITGSVVDAILTGAPYSNASGNGVTVTGDGVTLGNLTIKGFYAGIELGNGIEGLTLNGVDLTEGVVGILKATMAVVDDLTITGGSIADIYHGMLIQKGVGGGKLDGLTVTGTSFTHVGEKGIYLETGSNVLITGITMTDVAAYGRAGSFGIPGTWGTGIDINLKYDDGVPYSNIVIENFAMTNVGVSNGAGSSHLGGAAISIKARDDGPSYNSSAASFSGQVIVRNGIIDTTSTGVRAGEPGKNLAAPGVTAVTGPAVYVENVTVSNFTAGMGDNVSLTRMEVVLTGSDDTWTFNPATTGPVDVWGDAGNDAVGGGAGADNLFGGDGNDLLVGNAGGDTLTGGLGDDALIGGAGADVLNGGDGSDWAVYASSASGVQINLLLGTATGGDATGDTLALIENVAGSTSADQLVGNGGDNTLDGAAGNDVLDGGGGNDLLIHADGDDTITGGDGDDTVEFDLDWEDYTITRSGSSYTVVGGGFTDIVTGVEEFIFNGTTISVVDDPDSIVSAAAPVIDSVVETGIDEDSDPDTFEVAEDAASGTEVAIVTASDSNEAAGETLTYELVDGAGDAYTGPFAILNDAGVRKIVTTAALDHEAAASHSFVLRVTDSAGHHTDQSITVGVLDVNEAPSAISLGSGVLAVDENAEGAVIIDVIATDPDGDTLTWTTDDSRFEVADIGGGTMALRLKAGESLDAETETDVTVLVTATDPDGLFSTRSINFSVVNIDEAPVVAGGLGVWTPGAVEAGLRRAVLTNAPTIIDPEGSALTYKLVTAPVTGSLWSGATQVVLNAVLSQAEFDALTYAAPNTAGNRSAVFEVSDDHGNTSALNVTLAVSAAVNGTYSGADGEDYLDGGAGNDVIRGLAGDDIGYGGAGADILNGGTGNDTMLGGLGNDIYRVDSTDDVVVELAGEGNVDVVTTSVDYTLAAGSAIEGLYIQDRDNTTTPLNLTGNELRQVIRGNLGDNTLDSGVGEGDLLAGGAGNDTYLVRNADDDVVEAAGEGGDVVMAAVSYVLGGNAEIEVLRTIDDAATTAINLTGNSVAQTLIGNDGDNRLDGRRGMDVLTGNDGADTFVFVTAVAPVNAKTITDFTSGEDVLELAASVFSGLTAGALDADALVVNTTGLAEGTEDRIIYNSVTGEVLFDADGAGGAAARVFATLQLGATLTSDDISIV